MRFCLTVLASVLLISGSAYADTISASAVSSFTLGSSADTLSFNSSSETVNASGVFTQNGTFDVGNSNIPNQTISFTFTDDVTVDGVSKNLIFQGQDVVTTGPDTLTIDALGPEHFGNIVLSFGSFTVEGNGTVGQSLPVTLSASEVSPTPEPGSIALLGTGLFGLAALLRLRA